MALTSQTSIRSCRKHNGDTQIPCWSLMTASSIASIAPCSVYSSVALYRARETYGNLLKVLPLFPKQRFARLISSGNSISPLSRDNSSKDVLMIPHLISSHRLDLNISCAAYKDGFGICSLWSTLSTNAASCLHKN